MVWGHGGCHELPGAAGAVTLLGLRTRGSCPWLGRLAWLLFKGLLCKGLLCKRLLFKGLYRLPGCVEGVRDGRGDSELKPL